MIFSGFSSSFFFCNIDIVALREDTHKKNVFFLVVGPLRFYPPYTNDLVVHVTFFFSLIMARNRFENFFFYLPIFALKQPDFREKKKWFFALWSGGFTLSTPFWSDH